MGNLKKLILKTSYHKGTNNIAKEFYLPCMSCALAYDRAVGFFNSTVYSIAWPSLKDFVDVGGKMRIICSPILSPDDIEALEEGYNARIEQQSGEVMRNEVRRLLEDPYLNKPGRVLASLVSMGVIEIKVAFMRRESIARRLFHDKLGIFRDGEQNTVVFKGSMNETWRGLSADGNLESVDVFVDWEDAREASRVADEIGYFESLWQDNYPGVIVREFPKIARDELLNAADPANWEQIVQDICDEIKHEVSLASGQKYEGKKLRAHQADSIEKWFINGQRGIFEHATGSGKTFTALSLIRLCLDKGLSPLILVPSELLLEQWSEEVRSELGDLKPDVLLCGGGNVRWREGLIGPWTKPTSKARITISTMQTASNSDFLSAVRQGSHLLIVADEVHRIGSQHYQKILALDSGARLGLSATPRRAGDSQGTEAIFAYFGGVIQPPFTLKDAIIAGVLTPYIYHVHGIALSSTEQSSWDEISARISQHYAVKSQKKDYSFETDNYVKNLLIQRARILKTAEAKIPLAAEILRKHYRQGERWIIYCDSQDQLYAVVEALQCQGLPVSEYHTAMSGDRTQTLRYFESNGGIIVSIRCLDEGVDIPSVSHALILASSKNPREFIQRRGRVLRRYPDKYVSEIHDAIVLPYQVFDGMLGTAILEGELMRAIEFGRNAVNPACISDLERLALQFGIDLPSIAQEGVEDNGE
ncbi:MAG: DEAD/DEAH box helicase family protein [Desulfarculaceae bacterium]|nr:DEAD/DEAH box helicase family protein [Desulfarculaceae bacterium]